MQAEPINVHQLERSFEYVLDNGGEIAKTPCFPPADGEPPGRFLTGS